MYIFFGLGFIGKLATVIGTIVIAINSGLDCVLEISKNGYKIDKRVLDEYQSKQAKEKQKISGVKKALGCFY